MTGLVPLARYEEKYLISPSGGIWNRATESWNKATLNPNGYLKVGLAYNGLREQLLVHRLVALHFIPNPYQHSQVNHKDGNKQNNQVSNLEWVSASENVVHALKMGLNKRGTFMALETKVALLERALSGEILVDLAAEIGWGPESLTRMLRTTADKKGLRSEWNYEMKQRRRRTAMRNLERANDKHL